VELDGVGKRWHTGRFGAVGSWILDIESPLYGFETRLVSMHARFCCANKLFLESCYGHRRMLDLDVVLYLCSGSEEKDIIMYLYS